MTEFSEAAIFELAEATRRKLGGGAKALRRLIEDAEIAFGVFPDPARPGGRGMLVIKGEALLQIVAADGTNQKARVAAVPCREAEEAEAMRQVFGDGA